MKLSWRNWGIVPLFSWKDWWKVWKTPVRVDNALANKRSKLNSSQIWVSSTVATPTQSVNIDTVTNNGKILVFIIFGIGCLWFKRCVCVCVCVCVCARAHARARVYVRASCKRARVYISINPQFMNYLAHDINIHYFTLMFKSKTFVFMIHIVLSCCTP
jgi:hypothetical protein